MIELYTQPYSQDIAEHNTDPTAQRKPLPLLHNWWKAHSLIITEKQESQL